MSKVNPWKDQVALYFLSIGVISVDDKGRIWRLRDRRRGEYIKPKRTEYKYQTGYSYVPLCFNGKQYNIYAHRIVWLTLKGVIPEDLQINHKNGIKDDNRPENLELVTAQQNSRHSFDELGRKGILGMDNGMAKVTESQVIEMREYYRNNTITHKTLGEMHGIARPTAREIITRKTWKHI